MLDYIHILEHADLFKELSLQNIENLFTMNTYDIKNYKKILLYIFKMKNVQHLT